MVAMTMQLLFHTLLVVGVPVALANKPATGYRLTVHYETSGKSSDGGTSSSNGHTTYSVKRVATAAGEQVIYDLPADATPEERAREWLLPATIGHGRDGAIRLLNETALEKRRDA